MAELLKVLVKLDSNDGASVRALFLTRRSIDDWRELILDCRADRIVDMKPVVAHGLTPADAFKVFCSAEGRAAKYLKSEPVHVKEEQLTSWLAATPENQRALFIVAAALHSAMNPKNPVVQCSGSEVIQAISEREVAGLRRTAENAGLKDPYALARVLAVAAVAGSLTEADSVKMAKASPDLFGLEQGEDIRKALRLISAGPERLIAAPKPDILAAAMVTRTLREAGDNAGELIWLGLEPDVGDGLNRVARLSYDAEIVLGLPRPGISNWLAEAVKGRKERCETLRGHFSEATLPGGWINAAVAMWRTLLDCAETEEDRAEILNNLSSDLSASGDNAGALEAIQEAVDVYRRLAAADPARYEPDLAVSLNNLSSA